MAYARGIFFWLAIFLSLVLFGVRYSERAEHNTRVVGVRIANCPLVQFSRIQDVIDARSPCRNFFAKTV